MLADRGFSLVPAFDPKPHPGTWVGEVPVDYSRAGAAHVGLEQLFREYRASGGVKLSIHSDGFVQLSRRDADGLLSGKQSDGRPRAFGYQSFMPTDPPRSGPSFGLSAWGLVEYPPAKPNSASLVFRPDEVYQQYPDVEHERNALHVDFWFIPRYALREGVRRGGITFVPGPPHPFYAWEPFEFAVADLGHPLIVIGVVVTAHNVDFSAPSGMSMGVMSDRGMIRTVMAISPPPHDKALPSADYKDARPALPEPIRVLTPTRWDQREPPPGRCWGRARPAKR